MLVSKKQLDIATFASKDASRGLNSVLIAPTYSIATDSYRLVKVKYGNTRAPEDKPLDHSILITADTAKRTVKAMPKGVDVADLEITNQAGARFNINGGTVNADTLDASKYPKADMLIDGATSGKVQARIRVNASYLEDIAAYMAKYGRKGAPYITLEIRGEDAPLVIKSDGYDENDGTTRYSEGALALLMPIRT